MICGNLKFDQTFTGQTHKKKKLIERRSFKTTHTCLDQSNSNLGYQFQQVTELFNPSTESGSDFPLEGGILVATCSLFKRNPPA